MVRRVCARIPWMADGTFRTAHGGQDGITTADQRPILGRAGPDGFYLACGFSGTGFKTAPAVGLCLTELILDGAATTVDISGYALERFARAGCSSATTVRQALALTRPGPTPAQGRSFAPMGTIDPRRHRPRELRPHAAVRRPGLRPPLVRLLGGRRPRLEGGPPRRGCDRRRPTGPAPTRRAPGPANPFLADLEATARPPTRSRPARPRTRS